MSDILMFFVDIDLKKIKKRLKKTRIGQQILDKDFRFL